MSSPRTAIGLALAFGLMGVVAASAAAPPKEKRLPVPQAPYWAHTRDAPAYSLAGGKSVARLVLEGQAYMGVLEAKPGFVVPKHTHPRSIEMLYVLEGGGWMTIAGKRAKVVPGMVIQVPAGVEHSFEIPSDFKGGDFKAVQVYTVAGPQKRFKKGKLLPPAR